jgi:hypothetical protein
MSPSSMPKSKLSKEDRRVLFSGGVIPYRVHRLTVFFDFSTVRYFRECKHDVSETGSVFRIQAKGEEDRYSQGNGPFRYIETCPDIFFFTARVHTTKSTVKILAAKTHCKYFLKIAEHCQYFNL